VAEALKAKHRAEVVAVAGTSSECRAALKARLPRYVCIVARPEEIDGAFVRGLHKLARTLDDDPYEDFQRGIVTGFTAADALRVAQATEPLTVRTGLNSTPVDGGAARDGRLNLSDAQRGRWYLEEPAPVPAGSVRRLGGTNVWPMARTAWRAEASGEV
jgi:hypothetical protein